MRFGQYVHEQGIFVGVANLKDDPEIHKQSNIDLVRLRHIVLNTLQLHPFMPLIET